MMDEWMEGKMIDRYIDIAHPHSSIAYCWSVFSQSQNEQIHLILAASTYTKAKTFHTLFQLNREEIKILQAHANILRTSYGHAYIQYFMEINCQCHIAISVMNYDISVHLYSSVRVNTEWAAELPVASCSLVRGRCEGQWTAACSPAVGGVCNRALAAVGNLLQVGVGSPLGAGGNQWTAVEYRVLHPVLLLPLTCSWTSIKSRTIGIWWRWILCKHLEYAQ